MEEVIIGVKIVVALLACVFLFGLVAVLIAPFLFGLTTLVQRYWWKRFPWMR